MWQHQSCTFDWGLLLPSTSFKWRIVGQSGLPTVVIKSMWKTLDDKPSLRWCQPSKIGALEIGFKGLAHYFTALLGLPHQDCWWLKYVKVKLVKSLFLLAKSHILFSHPIRNPISKSLLLKSMSWYQILGLTMKRTSIQIPDLFPPHLGPEKLEARHTAAHQRNPQDPLYCYGRAQERV